MTKPRLISMIAERAASHPAMAAALNLIIREVLHEISPGENLRLYGEKSPKQARTERDLQIAAALRTNEAQKSIARRHGVSLRHVERVKSRMTRQLSP